MITRMQRPALATVAALLLAAGTGAAQAEGLYVGGNLGSPHYRDSINGVSGDGNGVGFKLFGGYQLTPNFAVEAGIFDLGRIDNATGKLKLRGVYADGVGNYMFLPKWSLLGSVGLAQGRFNTSFGNGSSPAIKLGTGLQYDLNDRMALRLQYEHYHFTSAYDRKSNVGEVSFGVKLGF